MVPALQKTIPVSYSVKHIYLPHDPTGFPDSSAVNNPPARQETPVQFLGREDLLEKGKAAHSSILGLPWWRSW